MLINDESIKHRILGGAEFTSLPKDKVSADDAVAFIKKTYKPEEIKKAHDDKKAGQEMITAYKASKGLKESSRYVSKFQEAIPLMPIQKNAQSEELFKKLQKLSLDFYKKMSDKLTPEQASALIEDLESSIKYLRTLRGK